MLKALACQPVDRAPWWMMRQAGRYLPEYRALKEQHDFLTLVKTPELATEVTLQPLRRFPLDAAILFSDILVIPEALGQPYHFRDQGGIGMDFALDSPAAIERLDPPEAVAERLAYVPETLRLLRAELAGRTALLGFGGSPWTLATYMVEGGSSKNFTRVKALFHENPATFEALMEQLTQALIRYFTMQIEAGADAVQIFDSWAAVCPCEHYEAMSLSWIRRIVAALDQRAPVILYAKGAPAGVQALAETGVRALGLDWSVDMPRARDALDRLPAPVATQGNLDPVLLSTTPEVVRREATRWRERLGQRSGVIFNLGHGILPSARIDCVEALAEVLTRAPAD